MNSGKNSDAKVFNVEEYKVDYIWEVTSVVYKLYFIRFRSDIEEQIINEALNITPNIADNTLSQLEQH